MDTANLAHASLIKSLVQTAQFNLSQLERLLAEAKASSVAGADLLRQRAFALYYSRNDSAAAHALNVVAATSPSADVYVTLGQALLRSQRYEEALEAAQAGLSLDEKSFMAHQVVAAAHLALGHLESARQHAKEAVALSEDPRNAALLDVAERALVGPEPTTLSTAGRLGWAIEGIQVPAGEAWLRMEDGVGLIAAADHSTS